MPVLSLPSPPRCVRSASLLPSGRRTLSSLRSNCLCPLRFQEGTTVVLEGCCHQASRTVLTEIAGKNNVVVPAPFTPGAHQAAPCRRPPRELKAAASPEVPGGWWRAMQSMPLSSPSEAPAALRPSIRLALVTVSAAPGGSRNTDGGGGTSPATPWREFSGRLHQRAQLPLRPPPPTWPLGPSYHDASPLAPAPCLCPAPWFSTLMVRRCHTFVRTDAWRSRRCCQTLITRHRPPALRRDSGFHCVAGTAVTGWTGRSLGS